VIPECDLICDLPITAKTIVVKPILRFIYFSVKTCFYVFIFTAFYFINIFVAYAVSLYYIMLHINLQSVAVALL